MFEDESLSKNAVADTNEDVALDYEADEEHHEAQVDPGVGDQEVHVGDERHVDDEGQVGDEPQDGDEHQDRDEVGIGGVDQVDTAPVDGHGENSKAAVAVDRRRVLITAPTSTLSSKEKDEAEEDEELEEGELSDEERLKPAPVCRFYNRGHCTWGNQCRFLHPGIMDKGNYNMFDAPRPFIPGLPKGSMENANTEPPEGEKQSTTTTSTMTTTTTTTMTTTTNTDSPAPMTRIESAWERGLRQAKEMRRKSQLRKETDLEYEEKRTAMSLTQAELDNENYYYAKPASPLHEPGFLANDDFSDFDNDDFDDHINNDASSRNANSRSNNDDFKRRQRRERGDEDRERRSSRRRDPSSQRTRSRRSNDREDNQSTDNRRRVTRPPKTNDTKTTTTRRVDRGDKWADPWMRNNDPGLRDRLRRPRRDSSEESSSRSSSSSSSSRGSSSGRRRHRNDNDMSSSRRMERLRRGRGRRSRSSSSSSSRTSSIDEPLRNRSIKKSPTRSTNNNNTRKLSNNSSLKSNQGLTGSNATPLQRRSNPPAPLQKRLNSQVINTTVATIKKENMSSRNSSKNTLNPTSISSREKTSEEPSNNRRSPPFRPSNRPAFQSNTLTNSLSNRGNSKSNVTNKQKRPALPPVLPMDDTAIKSESSKRQPEGQQEKRGGKNNSNGVKPQIRMTLKATASAKPNVSQSVLMKLNQDDSSEQQPDVQDKQEDQQNQARNEEQVAPAEIGSKHQKHGDLLSCGIEDHLIQSFAARGQRKMGRSNSEESEDLSTSAGACPVTPEQLPTAPTPPPKGHNTTSREPINTEKPPEDDRSSSPEPHCAICLGKFENMSYTDNCLHKFCFNCLLQWSRVKTECPLCKVNFKSIIHNVRADDNYESYAVPTIQPSQPHVNQPFVMVDMPSLSLSSSSLNRFIATWRPQVLYGRHGAEVLNASNRVLPNSSSSNRSYIRSSWRRRRSAATSEFRREVYSRNLYVDPRSLRDVTGRYRECSPSWFRNNPTASHRLVPWLNREFNVLLSGGQEHHSAHLMQRVLDQLERSSILSQEMTDLLQPYLTLHTEHFQHELYNFARSVYDMVGYDRHADYTHGPPPIMRQDEDDEVIVVQPSSSSSVRSTRNRTSTTTENDESVQVIDVVDRVEERRRRAIEVIDLANSSDENAHDNNTAETGKEASEKSDRKKRPRRKGTQRSLRDELGEGTSRGKRASASATNEMTTRKSRSTRRSLRPQQVASTATVLSSSESESGSKKMAKRSRSISSSDEDKYDEGERRKRKSATIRSKRRAEREDEIGGKSRKSNDPTKIKRSRRRGREEARERRNDPADATESSPIESRANGSESTDPSRVSLSAEESEPLAKRFSRRAHTKAGNKQSSRRVVLKENEMVNVFTKESSATSSNTATININARASGGSLAVHSEVDLRTVLEKRRGGN